MKTHPYDRKGQVSCIKTPEVLRFDCDLTVCLCAIDVISLCLCLCVWGYQPPQHLLAEQGNGHAADLEMENGQFWSMPCHRNQPKILMKMKYYNWANHILLRTAYFNVMNKGLYSRSIKRSMTVLQCVDSRVTNWCLSWMSPVKQHFIFDNHNMSKQLPKNQQKCGDWGYFSRFHPDSWSPAIDILIFVTMAM